MLREQVGPCHGIPEHEDTDEVNHHGGEDDGPRADI